MGFSDALPPYPPVYSATGSLPSSPGGSHTSIDLGREHEKRSLAPDADEDDHAPAYDHQRAFEEVTEEEADVGGYGRRSRVRFAPCSLKRLLRLTDLSLRDHLRAQSQTRRSRLVLLALVSFAILVGLFAAGSWKSPLRPTVKLKKHLDLDLVLNGTFGVRESFSFLRTPSRAGAGTDCISSVETPAERKQVAWVKEAGDGWFSTVDEDHNIFLENVGTAPSEDFDNEQASEELLRRQTDTVTGNLTRLLVNATWIKDESGEVLQWSDWKLCAFSSLICLNGHLELIHSRFSFIQIARHAVPPPALILDSRVAPLFPLHTLPVPVLRQRHPASALVEICQVELRQLVHRRPLARLGQAGRSLRA